jgi:hypothetical protein
VKPNATVPTTGLEAGPRPTGAVAILETVHAEQRAATSTTSSSSSCRPCTELVARNITDLRERLVKRYGEAAL